ncbi:hypothetical protein F1880_009675 [Penicillium rolfsii]|nr:hypothetical protein F1880_009675 [Penicillium rolfsii]
MSLHEYVLPAFDELPQVDGQPQGCLWGFFDRNGRRDELGTLNLLTPSVVWRAAREIQTGIHIQLDWSLDNMSVPPLGRLPLAHNIIDMRPEGFQGLDDEIQINTQTGSQWDSLRHWSIQSQGLFYNGLQLQDALTTDRNGIHNICERGGIVGRGVLVDWLRWWEHQNPSTPPPSPVTRHAIPISEIEQALKWQGTEIRQGDLLLLRTGYVRWHKQASVQDRRESAQSKISIGVESNIESVRWFYEKHFAAVAADNLSFEVWPYEGCCLHEWLLCQWGTPIGELWDLEHLSQVCDSLERWTFFLTSAPLHVKGGVGSPPGAIAIL